MAEEKNLKEVVKLRKEINASIEKENRLLSTQKKNSKEYLATLERITVLEKKGVDLSAQELELTRKSSPLYKQINSMLAERTKKLTSMKTLGSDISDIAKKNIQNTRGLLNLLQKSVSVEGEISPMRAEQLEVLQAIGSGANDIAGIQAEIAQSEKRQTQLRNLGADKLLAQEQTLSGILQGELKILQAAKEKRAEGALFDKITGGLASKAKDFKKQLEEASPKEKAFLIATAALTAGLVVLKQLVNLGKEFAKTFDKIGEQFGSINLLGRELQGQILASNIEAIKLGSNVGDIGSVASELASNFGMTLEEATGLSVKVIDTSKALGISVSEGTQLFGVLTQTANLSAEQAEKLSEGAAQLARQRGVAPAQVMKDIAGSAETIALFTKDSGENIFDAAIAARQFGMSINDIASSMKGMLDFESSINAELEASAILGKTINLQRARELALNKDAVGFQKEIKSQLEGIGNFNDLGILQQESLAKALNMNVAQVAKLANGTAEIGDGLGDQSFEDLLGKDALSNFSQLAAQLSSIGAILVSSVGPALGSIAGFLVPVLEGFGKFLTYLNESGALMPMLMTALGGLGVALTATGIKFAFLAGKAIYSTFASLGAMVGSISASTLGLGALGAIALAGVIGAAVKSMMSDANAIAVDDMYAGPGGITTMMGPAGIFSLNPRDSVLATTNPIPVTKVNEFPAEGALMPGHSPSTMVNVGGEFRIHSGDLRLLTERQENGGGDLGVPTITYS